MFSLYIEQEQIVAPIWIIIHAIDSTFIGLWSVGLLCMYIAHKVMLLQYTLQSESKSSQCSPLIKAKLGG